MQNTRNTTNFFNKRPAAALWKSVTSVSNAGRRRGRAKGIPQMKDLNKGQKVGIGKVGMVFPGLNSALLTGNKLNVQEKHPILDSLEIKSSAPHSKVTSKRYRKVSILERGWTSASLAGRKIGPPDPVDDESFEGFESWILRFKVVNIMTNNFGRVKKHTVTVLTGNRNGLIGFATVKGKNFKPCVIRAKNRAAQKLMYFQRYNDHTVLNDFFTQFGRTKIFVRQMPQGSGIISHRIIRVICEALGIKDMYAKVEGCTNPQHIIKAFLVGLLKQKPYQRMADEKRLHLVELRRENGYYPKILASPEKPRTKSELTKNEIIDFKQYVMNGKIVLRKKPRPSPFSNHPNYVRHLRKAERQRGQDDVRLRLRAEYGELRSFLFEKYPEARAPRYLDILKNKLNKGEVEE
ncbi:mitochondrial ribosomal protein S5 isoform X2 [Nomia melanderi]|nr:28S ribosomal protein S5, mitochondrial isoform X2 [Nomia melanderi]